MFWIVPILELVARAHGQQTVQIQVQPQIVGRSIRDGQVTTVFLAPRYVTAIRMPEPINSVVVGDPASFTAEHSDREPNLVFVKPITAKEAQTNLLISSTRGLQASLLLISRGEPKEEGQPAVDFLMRYKPAGQFMIQPADSPSAMIPQTLTVGTTTVSSASGLSARVVPASLTARGVSKERPALTIAAANSTKLDRPPLDDLLDRQRRAPLPVLYGQKPGIDWITALRAPAIKKLASAGVLQLSLFDSRDLAEITHPDFPGERLIACYNPLLAEERARKRPELLAATEKELDKIAGATRRPKRP